MMNQLPEWCIRLKSSIPMWLESLREENNPGCMRFCHGGGIITPSSESGLGATSMALKIAYQIGAWEQLEDITKHGWIRHIQAFQEPSCGYFEDKNLLAIADRNKRRFFFLKGYDKATRRAETRQSTAAIIGIDARPEYALKYAPTSEESVLCFLNKLDWKNDPWGAGSHASNLVFALKVNADVFDDNIALESCVPVVIRFLDSIRSEKTGSWHVGEVPLNQAVNSAMKVLTLYKLLDMPFENPERLIDLCLLKMDTRDACHSLDIIYVLHECARFTDYRSQEIQNLAGVALAQIERHCKPDGALSFFPDHANTTYYGVPVSHGLSESDVHGTHLLTWQITLCANLLGISDQLGWRIPIT